MKKRSWNLPMASYEKVCLTLARMALEKFRDEKDAEWFNDLRHYLHRKNGFSSDFSDWSLEGFGLKKLKQKLTRDEYLQFKAAWKQTKTGASNTVDIGP